MQNHAAPPATAEVPRLHGRDRLEPFVGQTGIAVCLLPDIRSLEAGGKLLQKIDVARR